MRARVFLVPPAFLLIATLLRPAAQESPVPRKPAVRTRIPAEPHPAAPPVRAKDLSWLHSGLDRGFDPTQAWNAVEESDPEIVAIQRKLDTMLIDLAFMSSPLSDILAFICDFSGLNIVMDARVPGPPVPEARWCVWTTDFPLRDALDFVLSLEGLAYRITQERVVRVGPRVDPDRY